MQKKTARDAKVLKELKDRRDKDKKERADARKTATTNAEKYSKEYQDLDRGLIESIRKAKTAGNLHVPSEPRLAFVIRTRG